MGLIVTARFQEQSNADAAALALQEAGFGLDQMTTFYVGSPGQHDLYPIGGDEMESPGMENAASNGVIAASVGGSVGLLTGLATLPVLGPAAVVAGTGIGAWVGSLYGALDGSHDPKKEASQSTEAPVHATTHKPPRRSGMLTAVMAATEAQQASARQVLSRCGGMDIAHAEGHIRAADWVDFDPLAPLNAFSGESA